MDSLRNKFKTLRNMKKPTGDPDCPPAVKRAKRADFEIQKKMGVETFDDDVLSGEGGSEVGCGAELAEEEQEGEERIDLHIPPVDVARSAEKEDRQQPVATTTSRTGASTAGTMRTGHTAGELVRMTSSGGSRHSTPSPSVTGRSKRTIDDMLGELSSGGRTGSQFMEMMLLQRADEANREARKEERERAAALEQERTRREEAREREAREDRREESNRQMMMLMMAAFGKRTNDS